MTLEEIRELVRNITVQNTLMMGGAILVRGMTQEQLLEIILLAQSRLCELENKRACDNPPNPS
jgi:hypothetical protein